MNYVHDKGRIHAEDEQGVTICELLYEKEDDLINVMHTRVAPVLRGQGIANELMQEIARYAKESGLQLKRDASCSYAVKWIGENNG